MILKQANEFVHDFQQRSGRTLEPREQHILLELAGNILRDLSFQKQLNEDLIEVINT